MNTTQLCTGDVEAYALATLTAPRKPGNRTAPRGIGPLISLLIQVGAILGFATAVTFLGLSAIGPYTAAQSHESTQLPAISTHAADAAVQPQRMDIVPSDVIDPNPVFFIGTGDGSAGFWTRP